MSVNLCWNFGRDSFKSDDIWEAVILLCSVYTFFSVTGLSVFSISSNPVVLVMRAFPFPNTMLGVVRETLYPLTRGARLPCPSFTLLATPASDMKRGPAHPCQS